MNVSTLMRIAGAFAVLVPAGPPASVAEPLATTRLRQVTADPDTAFIVSVSVGELHNLNFLVDTAATRSVIAPWVRLALGLRSLEARDEEVTAAGGAFGVPGYILPPLRIGDAVQHELRVVVLDVGHNKSWIGESIDGILGTDFLRNYDIWLNGGEEKIEFNSLSYRPKLPAVSDSGFSRVSFQTIGAGFMVVPVSVNGHEILGVLDTGASRSVLNGLAAKLAGLLPAAGTPMDITGADGKPIHIVSQSLAAMTLGGVAYGKETVSVGDLPVFRQFRLDDVPAMILGASVVKDRLTLISHSTNSLYLSRSTNRRTAIAPLPTSPNAG